MAMMLLDWTKMASPYMGRMENLFWMTGEMALSTITATRMEPLETKVADYRR
jgi:hypothetical protein